MIANLYACSFWAVIFYFLIFYVFTIGNKNENPNEEIKFINLSSPKIKKSHENEI